VTPLLRFVGVGKWFGRTPVLENLNLEVAEGELFVLLGPSGCGKSTILRMTAGLEPLSSGEIFLRDAPISRTPPEHRNIAMVFQDYALYPHMTVYQNMAFGLRRHGVGRQETDTQPQGDPSNSRGAGSWQAAVRLGRVDSDRPPPADRRPDGPPPGLPVRPSSDAREVSMRPQRQHASRDIGGHLSFDRNPRP
jgi:ABC-type branched-subunit amino acid transport system ATPase component